MVRDKNKRAISRQVLATDDREPEVDVQERANHHSRERAHSADQHTWLGKCLLANALAPVRFASLCYVTCIQT